MRMWMVDPRLLCDTHLLGEHGEIHKFRHCFVKQHRMDTRVRLHQIEPASMQVRHDALAAEMVARGMKHQSPYELPDLSYLGAEIILFRIDPTVAHAELIVRCTECFERYMEGMTCQS